MIFLINDLFFIATGIKKITNTIIFPLNKMYGLSVFTYMENKHSAINTPAAVNRGMNNREKNGIKGCFNVLIISM